MADRRIPAEFRAVHTVLQCSACRFKHLAHPEDHRDWPWCCGRPMLIRGWTFEELYGGD